MLRSTNLCYIRQAEKVIVMGVSFEKLQQEAPHLVSLAKNVQQVSLAKGLDPSANPAAVVAILDTSPSNEKMVYPDGRVSRNRNYSSGLVPQLSDLVLAAGFTFDDDGSVPLGYFNRNAYDAGNVTPATSQGFVERTYHTYLGSYTNYLAALQWIVRQVDEFAGINLGRGSTPLSVKFRASMPLFAIFVTDGEPTDDQRAIVEYIRRMSQLPIFIQFVGVGVDNNFAFLKSLDSSVPGRLIDNCGFFNAMELGVDGSVSMDAVLSALLNEFPTYYREARRVGLIG